MAKLSVLAIGLLLLCSGASGQTRDQKTEEELLVPLRERSPEAAEAFRKATIDLDAQRTTEATRGYQEVLRHVPGHPPSLRRLSHLASESEEAIRLARSALGTDAAPENQAALLVALVRDVPIPQKRREEAQSLAKTVQPRAVSNRILLLTLAQASVALSDQGLLAACVDGLRRLDPIEDARRELLAARRLGFQPSAVDPLLEQLRVASTDRAGKESGAPTRLSPESMVPPEMTRLQLQAILAHEYGHFSNQDTAGGNLALHVRRTVLKSAEAMAKSGAASWYNPAWLFLNAFNRVFLRVSQGASRLQEVLADRWAVLTCGAVAFSTALAHVVRRSIEIDLLVGREVDEALESKRLVRNSYSLKAVEKTRDNASGGLAPGVASAKREKAASPCDEAQISSLDVEEAFHKAMRENASAYA